MSYSEEWFNVKGLIIGYLACDEDEVHGPQGGFEVLVVRRHEDNKIFLRPVALDVHPTDGGDELNCGVEVEFDTNELEQWQAGNHCERIHIR